MLHRQGKRMSLMLLTGAVGSLPGAGATTQDGSPGSGNVSDDVVLRAMIAELDRSMKELVLGGLERPYFIQYVVEDTVAHNASAKFGGVLSSGRTRRRTLNTDVRVGSYELDDGNLGFGGFSGGVLPLDDDERAIRHAIWLATDADYKVSVELLTRKRAALKEMNVEDRPNDFSPVPPVQVLDPHVTLEVDGAAWTENIRRLSARFLDHPHVDDAQVTFFAGHTNRTLVNSEGTRYRHGDTGIFVNVSASARAADGMDLAAERMYIAEAFDQLPSLETMLADLDALAADLKDRAAAGTLEHYIGPVLFDAEAAGVVLNDLLADALAAKPVILGSRSAQDDTMEKKIGLRILPRFLSIVDDPNEHFFEGTLLAGHGAYDDEAVRAQRVSLVENGILKTLVTCRTPSRKFKESNGHGQGRFGTVNAHVANLFVEASEGLTQEELEAELLQAARDEGLEFALHVRAIESGGAGSLGDPLRVDKVYVADGRRERIRGVEFTTVDVAKLKDILAAGTQRKVYNDLGFGAGTCSVVCPALLFEELELTRVEPQFDRLPILKPPSLRTAKTAP